MTYHYVWLFWSSAFLLAWILLFVVFQQHRVEMWRASVSMAPFGLTEPIFVPEYWNPPSLFELAQRTGFDIESVIFTFAIGGIGTVLYNIIMRKRFAEIDPQERNDRRRGSREVSYLQDGEILNAMNRADNEPIVRKVRHPRP